MEAVAAHESAGLAAEALRLSIVLPQEAERLGERAEQAAMADGDWPEVSAARRARGVAALQARQLDAAVTHLKGAISAARRAGDLQLDGEAQMSLASALMLRGSPRQAFAAIDTALSQLSGVSAARARTQRSAILQELGRVDEALEDLRLALPVLRRQGEVRSEIQALSNRSLLLTARRQFTAAEADLVRASRLSQEHGLTVASAYVEQNLGCVYAGRGDVPAALEHFDAAEDRYRELDLKVGSLMVDRATVLLSVRLVAEARAAAEAAVTTYKTQTRKVHLPEAQLMVSTAALLQNDVEAALTAARAAARSFSRLGRTEWLALAHFAQLQAQVARKTLANRRTETSDSPWVSPRRARAVADELELAGWTVPALDARVLAGRLALRLGQRSAAREDLVVAARARRSGPADARARAWLGEALLREAEGQRRSAKLALRAGVKVVEDYRATLGATELRAHVSVQRGDLARAGLRMSLEEGNARSAYWWAERGRASAGAARPLQPPEDPVLAHHLEDLRATMAEIDTARGEGARTASLVTRQVQLERRIRDHCRHSPNSDPQPLAPIPTIGELAADLGDTMLVEFVTLNGALHAITLVDGQARLHALGSDEPIRHSLTHLPFALHRLARLTSRPAQLAAAESVLTRAAQVLDSVLFTPLAKQLRDRQLLVIPGGWLQSVPWSILPSCAGRPVTVTPSTAIWRLANRRRPQPGSGVVAVAGPGLPGAEAEAVAVAALYPEARILAGTGASASSAAAAMNGARLAHVAAHGTVRADNPLFSSLRLSDGPFTVYDLERLGRSPHQVVLAACDTALSHVTAGEEILGLAGALLSQQTATLIAPVIPVPDAETLPLMVAYHRLLVAGHTPASALALAQQRHRSDSSRAHASAAGFVCLGAGHAQP